MANLASGGVTIVGLGLGEAVTFNAASGLAATDVGTPVSQDTTAANTVKKAVDGGEILGVLQAFEDRVQEGVQLASVWLEGGFRFTYKSGDLVAVGDSVVSAGSGEVKKAGAANNTRVYAKDTTNRTVDVMVREI